MKRHPYTDPKTYALRDLQTHMRGCCHCAAGLGLMPSAMRAGIPELAAALVCEDGAQLLAAYAEAPESWPTASPPAP